MRTYHTIFSFLGCLALMCDAWPVGIPAYHARAVNPYYTTVGGSSIVNVFPSGYSYQTLLDDGSSTYVVYVSGPEAHQYLHHLSRSPPLPHGVAVNHEQIPTIAPSIDIETATAAAPTPSVPTEVTTVVASTSKPNLEEAKPVDITPELPLRPTQPIVAPQQPLFQFYPFTPFSTFPVLSNYIANPFNSLMSLFGMPGQAAPTNLTSSNNNDAQASNVNSVIAPLSTRIAIENESTTTAAAVAPAIEPSTESIAITPEVSPSVEAVTQTASTENTSQNSENSLREETTVPVTSAVTAETVARIVVDTTTVTEATETSSTAAEITSNSIPEAIETTSSTESTVESSSTSTVAVDVQSTTTEEMSTLSSQ